MMTREFIAHPRQTVEYYAMWGMENGKCQACHIAISLSKRGVEFSERQISGALQRLKSRGLCSYDGRWSLTKLEVL